MIAYHPVIGTILRDMTVKLGHIDMKTSIQTYNKFLKGRKEELEEEEREDTEIGIYRLQMKMKKIKFRLR